MKISMLGLFRFLLDAKHQSNWRNWNFSRIPRHFDADGNPIEEGLYYEQIASILLMDFVILHMKIIKHGKENLLNLQNILNQGTFQD